MPTSARARAQSVPSWVDDALRDYPPLGTVKQFIELTNMSEREFYRLKAMGRIKTVQRNGDRTRIMIPRASVRAYLESLEK